MKCNSCTMALVTAGLVTLPVLTQAEEKPSSVLTALTPTTLSGYVDTSMQWNMGTGNNYTPTYAWGGSTKADGFNLNVVQLILTKPADAAEAWSAGYTVDLLAGPDADAFGTLSKSSADSSAADFAVKQAYVDLHAPVGNGLGAKVGVWDTLIGYEVFSSALNPNFTRSYGYTIEPTTHTGVQLYYTVNDMISVAGGIANSYGPNINTRANPPKAESFKTYMGQVTFTASTNWGWIGGSTLTGVVLSGYNSALNVDGTGGDNETSAYVGATVNTPLTALKVGASYDYVFAGEKTSDGAAPAGATGQVLAPPGDKFGQHAQAVAVYATYQATDKLTLNARGEYADGNVTFGTVNPFGAGYDPTTGTFRMSQKVVAATFTAQYDLWKNVLSRLEFRWDHSASGAQAYGGGDPGSANPPSLRNSYILLANFVYKF